MPAPLRQAVLLATASITSAALRRPAAAPTVHVPAQEACAPATLDGQETHAAVVVQALLLRRHAQRTSIM